MAILNMLSSGTQDSLLGLLKSDHAKVKALLGQILDSEDGKERIRLFREFARELTAHSRAEEKVLYRRMQKSEDGKDEALEGFVEHQVADGLTADLKRARSPAADAWTARCTVLKELLEHHIEEEEGEFFRTARRMFDRATLMKMGGEFLAEKAKYGVGVDADKERKAAAA